jgi:hypothetical protein
MSGFSTVVSHGYATVLLYMSSTGALTRLSPSALNRADHSLPGWGEPPSLGFHTR